MTLTRKPLCLLTIALAVVSVSAASTAQAQQEGPALTQTIIAIDSKAPVAPTTSNILVKVDNHVTPLTNIAPVLPAGSQVALLIDDGLRWSVARELDNLRSFVQSLPPGTEIFVGYLQNGRVVAAHDFTANLAAAAHSVHIPSGLFDSSASPYLCLSDFVKHWPSSELNSTSTETDAPSRKARFIMLISNGVDPYNGSTSIMNQNSPYVDTAVRDAQRAAVPIYSIYFSDAGMGGDRTSFSGQSYLAQLADGTGGRAYFEGTGNPVSLSPFLTQFQHAMAESYIATFVTPANKNLVRLKVTTNLHGAKLKAQDQIQPGTLVTAQPR